MRINFFRYKNARFLTIIYKVLTVVIALCWAVFICFFLFSGVVKRYIYPITFKEEVITYSSEYGLDKYLVFAIIKVESDFDESAKSDKGAKGLMQITDSTAEYVANLMGVKEYDVLDGKTNIKFGCYYLKYLIKKFEKIETAICAYNAGEGNVSSWLDNPEYSKDGKELERIPFLETKEYLKKIKKTFTKYEKIYENILDK